MGLFRASDDCNRDGSGFLGRRGSRPHQGRHYRAWELINAARDSTGDGGRRDALQDLNMDGVSLAAAPLERAYLRRVDLKGAHLEGACLQGAHLGGADLRDAFLINANLEGADLANSSLEGANLKTTHLGGAYLQGADLRGADLGRARNLTQEQLDEAIGDVWTVLPPEGLTLPADWSEGSPQPDDSGRGWTPDCGPESDK